MVSPARKVGAAPPPAARNQHRAEKMHQEATSMNNGVPTTVAESTTVALIATGDDVHDVHLELATDDENNVELEVPFSAGSEGKHKQHAFVFFFIFISGIT